MARSPLAPLFRCKCFGLRSALVACLLVLLALPGLLQAALPDPLPLSQGLIRGEHGDSIHVYRGIPYAAPPVAQNRWRAPQPAPVWAGVRDATRFAPRCIQRGFRPQSTQALSSEDCLYLNVWTPANSRNDLLPVLVWVHGGGFFAGAGSDAIYDGASLASKGAVVVTLNYRLGSFGLFAHPALSEESGQERSGNYALLDILAALAWVKDNIAAFGGDASRVTLFGESAGGQAVANLIASPLSDGLFKRAILQSSGWMGLSMGAQRSLAEHEAEGERLAAELGAHSLDELRSLSTEEIFTHFPTGGLVVDGVVLPEDASQIFANGQQQKVDVIVGSNRDEAIFFGPGLDSPEAFEEQARTRFDSLADDFLSLYPAADNAQANASDRQSFNDEVAWQMRQLARYQEETGRNAYVYFFTRVPPGQEERGATHVAELAYVFDQHAQNSEWQRSDRQLAETMARYWVNFAETGDPNRVGLPSWPVYTGHEPGKVLVLDERVRTEEQMQPPAQVLDFFTRAWEQLRQSLEE